MLTQTLFHLDKYYEIHTLLRCRYGDGGRGMGRTQCQKPLPPSLTKYKKHRPTKNMVVHVQHAPLRSQTHTPRSTSTNTNRYTTCCAVDMRTGGGGRGSHAVRQATHPHNIEMHQLPTKKRTVDDVQHAPLCSHTPHSPSTNINKYTRYCAVDIMAREGGHGAHAVRQATHTHIIKKKYIYTPVYI